MKSMKFFSLLIFTHCFSSIALAKIPATVAMNKLAPAGNYEGYNGQEKCFVNVAVSNSSVTVSIKEKNSYDVFAVLDNSSHYSVDANSGAFAATSELRFPHYVQGGTKQLFVISNDIDQVEFSISTILLDHRGNDASSYITCTISL
jgi:hypothetical protein